MNDSFRAKDFDCICDTEDMEYDGNKHISDYLESNRIIIVVCENDVGSRENISKFAKSILRRSKVNINNKRNNCWEYTCQY